METTTLHITGMACGGCASSVAQALLALPGVAVAEVSHAQAAATVRYDPVQVNLEQLRAAVARAGYAVRD